MLRLNRFCRAALPFEPMALTTLDALESKLSNAPPSPVKSSWSSPFLSSPSCYARNPDLLDSCHWFDCQHSGAPFFVSPKHDGIRVVSYATTPSATPSAVNSPRNRSRKKVASQRTDGQDANATVTTTTTTTYSRHGRALYGMFWIEKELSLLRALSMDPALILDGELYIHRQRQATILSRGLVKKERAGKLAKTTSKKATVVGLKHITSGGTGDDFKTGFLAVSALCHRLRGSKSQCATVKDILQYVSTLPHYCLFDVAAYSPPASTEEAELLNRDAFGRQVAAELRRVWEVTLASLRVTDAETLRCTPNITPFSQRMRTLHFLIALLVRGNASPILQSTFGVHEPTEMAASGGSAQPSKAGARKSIASQSSSSLSSPLPVALPSSYKGGVFVKMIPYELAHSLDEARATLLPLYEQRGYEGAVIRSPTNTYAMREKRKGVVRRLVAPLAELPQTLSVDLSLGEGGADHWRRLAVKDALRVGGLGNGKGSRESGRVFLLANTQGKQRKGIFPAAGRKDDDNPVVADGDCTKKGQGVARVTLVDNSAAIAKLAVERARHLPSRSETAVKLLPFKDKEYPVLRPLLKEPSTNPRTRPLLTVPVSVVCPDGDRSLIKVDPSNSKGESSNGTKAKQRGPSLKKNAGDKDMVVFYGLQCLAENGKVFNVTMPKLTTEQQRELLDNLLSSSKQRKGQSHGRKKSIGKSLTGTYVTVKYASLTEHGVPRFGQVKAIRGGKGWQM